MSPSVNRPATIAARSLVSIDDVGVAVFVSDRPDVPRAGANRTGNEIRDADPEIGNSRKPDKRLRQIEGKRKNASFEPESGRKHERQDDQKRHAFLAASKQQMPTAGHCPREDGNQVFVDRRFDLIGRGGSHYS